MHAVYGRWLLAYVVESVLLVVLHSKQVIYFHLISTTTEIVAHDDGVTLAYPAIGRERAVRQRSHDDAG